MTDIDNLWKCSIFNKIFYINNNILIFSSLSSSLLCLSAPQYELIKDNFDSIARNGRLKNPQLTDYLASNSFIVPYDYNENDLQHEKYLEEMHGPDHCIFVIAPTMKCNYSCTYCFERDAHKSGEMDRSTQLQLINLFRQKAEVAQRIDVQWFGGEPLLSFGLIRQLSDVFQNICAEKRVFYGAGIITNGSLLTPRIISQLGQLQITSLNITLDGEPDTFSQRKGISIHQGRNFYNNFFSYIPLILEQVHSLIIRINVDKDNYEESYYIVNKLKSLSLTDAKIDLRLGLLEGKNNIIDCIPHHCLTKKEYVEFDLQFKKYLASEGFTVYGFPTPLPYPCSAIKKQSYGIDPLGNVYRCVPEIGQKGRAFANLNDHSFFAKNKAEVDSYTDFDPWASDRCKDCTLLPICLGTCPRRQKYEIPFECTIKYLLPERLLFWAKYLKQHPLSARKSDY